MISFSEIMHQVLTERMSFKDILRISEPGRLQRAKTDVHARSIRVTTIDGKEAWTFTYKSNPSTTGQRWHGYVKFFVPDVSSKENVEDLDCKINCDCPDYTFRYAYNNNKEDAGDLGLNNGRPPRPRSQGGVGDYGVGACKHLISLAEFLKTKIEPNAPQPEEEPEPITKPPLIPKRITHETPPTTDAPEPEDTYTDSREGGYSDSRTGLQENVSSLYKRMEQFIKSNPEFDVPIDV